MRRQPRYIVGIIAAVVYLTIVFLLWRLFDVDYEAVADSTQNAIEGIVIPVGVGAAFLIGLTTWLGWWRPALRETDRVAPRWTLVVPLLMAVVAALTLSATDFSAFDAGYVPALALGVLLVGFSEELLVRGLALVGFRGSVSEAWAWFSSSVLFGLVHAINVLVGQSAADTVRQIIFAFLFGSALYVTRLSTGLLLVSMLLHAFWDFASLSFDGSGAETTSATQIGALLNYVTIATTLVAVLAIVRAKRRASASKPTRVTA